MTNFIDPEVSENQALRALVNFRDARVLEIGCGDGRLIRHFVQDAAQVFGIDSDWDEMRLAWEEYLKGHEAKVRLAQAQAEHLPYRPRSFDLVVMGWSL